MSPSAGAFLPPIVMLILFSTDLRYLMIVLPVSPVPPSTSIFTGSFSNEYIKCFSLLCAGKKERMTAGKNNLPGQRNRSVARDRSACVRQFPVFLHVVFISVSPVRIITYKTPVIFLLFICSVYLFCLSVPVICF